MAQRESIVSTFHTYIFMHENVYYTALLQFVTPRCPISPMGIIKVSSHCILLGIYNHKSAAEEALT